MTTVAVIQARMSSTRFPGKHLAPLAGKPMIEYVADACNTCGCVDLVVVATSTHTSDDPLAEYVGSIGYDVYRGSLNDPLTRAYRAAVKHKGEYVIRVTADCPLVDPMTIDSSINTICEEGLDYFGVTNSPDGNDVEVFTVEALQAAHLYANEEEREHTTTHLRNNPDRFKVRSIEARPEYADVHYSVNTIEDLRLCEQILAITGAGAGWQDHVEAYRKLKS